jgi:flagellar biosynthesis GTPase FlhF
VSGNPGAGKTTMIKELSKLALKKLKNDEIAIISFDDPRLGIWSQFQLIGAKLGIDNFKATSLETLKLILEDVSDKKFILIDLPGIRITENIKKLTKLNKAVRFHLAMPTDSSASAIESLVSLKSIKWSSIFLTRLNSEGAPWQLLETFNKNKLSCSYLCGNECSTDTVTEYDKDVLLETKFKKLTKVFECSSTIDKNMDKTSDQSIINNMGIKKALKNDHIIAPEEIMTDPLLAISKLVEKKHNLAKNL